MSRYLFSVVTPFHDVDMNMFEHAAQYMENQTIGFDKIEWVIVCHNCHDEYIEAVQKRVGSYDNVIIKILNNKIYTPSSPRNHGLDFATSDYVGFLDGDDNYRVDAVEKILDVFNRTKAQMVVYRREFELQHPGMVAISETVGWNKTYKEIIVSRDGEVNNRKYNDFPFFITSRAYDRKFLDEHNIRFDESITISEDCYFNLEVMHYADRICYCPQLIGYNYYINESSMLSAAKTDTEILTMIESAVKIIKRTFNYGIYPNVIIKSLCFVLSRYVADPRVSYDVKYKMKESLEGYLNLTYPLPSGRFTEPLNTLLNTIPQQIFASITKEQADMKLGDDQEVLTAILSTNRNTDFGKRYLFEDIVTRNGYQALVPISDYKTYAPLLDLQTNIGDKNIFLSEPVLFYAKNARGEFLPVSSAQQKEYVRCFSGMLKGSNVFLWESDEVFKVFNDGVSENTVWKVALAGYLDSYRYSAEQQPVHFTSPEGVYFHKNANCEEIEYTHILLALANRNVDQITHSFAKDTSALFQYIRDNSERLCNDIENGRISVDIQWDDSLKKTLKGYLSEDKERADEIRAALADPSNEGIALRIWPNLKYVTCATTGSQQDQFSEIVKEYYKGVEHSNGSLATSAGVFGEAVGDTNLYSLVKGVVFYEFLEENQDNAVPVFCSGLQKGHNYTLIVTTPSGLYRYNTGITIRVDETGDNITFSVQ